MFHPPDKMVTKVKENKSKKDVMAAAKMGLNSRLNLLKMAITVCCFGSFVMLSLEQYQRYRDEPTGSSLTRESVQDLPFPAITVCDTHYQNALAYEELGFPRSPIGSPKEVLTNPDGFIEKLTLLKLDIVPNLWKYFFSLDEVIHNLVTRAGQGSTPDVRCKVGNVNCVRYMGDSEVVIPLNSSQQDIELEVEAGKWRSRFLASSTDAKLYLCHTLVPNVTVGFAATGSNVFSFTWKPDYSRSSIYRRIYIHDRNEHVLLNSFALETVASVVVEQRTSFDYTATENKKKLQIIPKLVKHPEPSSVLPCKKDNNYSENWCNIQWGWHNKINAMRKYYGSNFTCVPPGVWSIPEEDPVPVCQHFEAQLSPNKTLGYDDIMKELAYADRDRPLMIAPPIGIYKSTSPCVRRCNLYTYTILEEPVSAYDTDIGESDIYIYFASPVVETWTEFRLMSMLDLVSGLGGNVGLLLGLSLLSMVFLLLDLVSNGIKGAMLSRLHL